MQLLLDSNGLILKKRNGSFWIIHKKLGRRLISPHRVSSIAVVRDCLISTAALRLAAKHQIPVYFCQANGKAEARLTGAGFGSIATIRRQQILIAEQEEATRQVISWFNLKMEQQIQYLKQWTGQADGVHKKNLLALLKQQQVALRQLPLVPVKEVRNTILGLEGSAARQYWAFVGQAVPIEWQFVGRSRQPATDPFNCVLNYWYGMLYNLVGSAVYAAGLDPYLGFFHVDGYNRPTLVFDMIEPFRPWVEERLVQHTAQQPKPLNSHFQPKKEGLWLSKAGRQKYIPLFNDFMEERIRWQQKSLSRKNHIYRFTRIFAQQLLKYGDDISG